MCIVLPVINWKAISKNMQTFFWKSTAVIILKADNILIHIA